MTRKILLALLVVVLVLLVAVPVGAYLWLRTSLPQTSGAVRVSGLDGPVEIVRDRWGVPHIFAGTDHDAFFGLGYVHAQDRLWQMEMNRRIGAGRLSEILGEATLAIDKFQRTMGYYRAVQDDFAALSPASQQILQAYADGVNQWLAEGHTLPPEFLLLGVKPDPWTPYDSLVWTKMMSWDLGGDYDLELLRARLVQALGPERAGQLLPDYPPDGANILGRAAPGTEIASAITAPLADALFAVDRALEHDFGRGGREVGSNDWVIGGDLTDTGLPLLADDPHLGTSIPAIWYLAELQGDRVHAIGSTFPGVPAIVIGHNATIAWGVTNVGPDVQDLYVERVNPANPNQYDVDGQWVDMTIVEEPILVKGEDEPIRWAARSTRHGPLISDVTETASPVALRWTALEAGDTTMDAFLGINYAANWEEFTAALEHFVTPSQNFVYADVHGNIGYYAPGRIPIRAAGHNGMLPAPGWDSQAEWQGYIPFAELPHTYNPASGYVATANNRVAGPDYPYLLSNDWAPPYRQERIVQMIEEQTADGGKITMAGMAAMQGDQTSTQVADLLPFFLAVPAQDERQQAALDRLQGWDGNLALDSVPSAIYEAWMLHFDRALFEDDLRGGLYDEMAGRSNPIFLLNVLSDPVQRTVWCDNVLSVAPESCEATAAEALDKALDDLETRLGKDMNQWQWRKLHIARFPHNPFGQVSYLAWLFDRSIPNGGDRYTVNAAPVKMGDPYNQLNGPGYRHIVNLADLNGSQYVITTGQSGNVLSSDYANLLPLWRDVVYVPMTFGRENVQGNRVLRLEGR